MFQFRILNIGRSPIKNEKNKKGTAVKHFDGKMGYFFKQIFTDNIMNRGL